MMRTDCHFHLDEEMVSLAGLIASMDAFGIERIALIANLCPPLHLPGFARFLLPLFRGAVHSKNKLAHQAGLAIYQSAVKRDGSVDLLGARYRIKAQPRNDEVLAAVSLHPDRFSGWVFVNPAGPVDPILEIERCLATRGMIGVKAHPFWHDYEVSLLEGVAAFCEERGRPLLVHLGTHDKGDFRLLPEAFPGLKIIYAHAGLPYLPAVCDYARNKKGVYVDLASSAYVDLKTAQKAVRRAGASKCLFGTDGPYFHAENDRFDFGPFLALLQGLGLDAADYKRIASENFAEIIGAS